VFRRLYFSCSCGGKVTGKKLAKTYLTSHPNKLCTIFF
jgi:hypothetical protein